MPTPSSPTQFAAFERGELPAPDRVAEGIWSVPLALPEGHRGGGVDSTLSYVLTDAAGRAHVVDPGWGAPAPFAAVERGLAAAGTRLENVTSILVTHQHPDHLGGARALREATGAPIVLHEAEQSAVRQRASEGAIDATRVDGWGVPAERRPELLAYSAESSPIDVLDADVLIRDGESLADHDIGTPGLDIAIVHTPGHTPGSVCIVERFAGVIITGDHVLPHMYPGLGLGGATPTNPISDYLVSLERVAIYDDMEVAPGHGYRFRGLADRCRQLGDHHRRRNAEVAVVLQQLGDGASAWEVASRIRWSRGFENLTGFILGSALAQTETHIDLLRRHGALDR